MRRFLKHNFKHDPGLSAIFVQAILKKKETDAMIMLGGISIKSLETQVEHIEKAVASLMQEMLSTHNLGALEVEEVGDGEMGPELGTEE
jgi:hypothetical protein